MVVTPSTVAASSTTNQLAFTFTNNSGAAFGATSFVTIAIPSGWTAASTSNTSFSAGTCTGSTLFSVTSTLITVGSAACGVGTSFTVNYGITGHTVTAPAALGSNTFTAQSSDLNNPNNPVTLYSGSPIVTVGSAPTFTSAANTTFTQGTAGSFTVATSGSPAVNSITNAAFSGCTLNDSATGLGFTYTSGTTATIASSTATPAGVYTFCLNASNGATTTQAFTLTVGGPPSITSASSAGFAQGTAGSFTVTTSGTPVVNSIFNTAFSGCTIDDTASGLSFSYTSGTTATIASTTGTPSGVYTFCLNASNSISPNATQTFTLTIGTPPAFVSASSYTAAQGVTTNFSVSTSGSPSVNSIVNANEGSCTVNAGGVSFVYTAGSSSANIQSSASTPVGVYTFCLTASNGISPAATQTFTFTVGNPPTITSANSDSFTQGTAGSFTVTTSGTPAVNSIVDTNAFAGCTISDTATGLTFTHTGTSSTATITSTTATPSGTYTFCLTASNGVVPNPTQAFTLTIGSAPTFSSAATDSVASGASGSFDVTTSGTPTVNSIINASEGSCTLNDTAAGLSFNYTPGASTATITSTASTPTGSYTFCFTASNGVTPAATQTFTYTVTSAPSITSANSATFTKGTAGSFTVTTSGSPAVNSITNAAFAGCTPSSLPTGVTFSYTSGTTATIASTTGAAAGVYTLCLNASNGVTPSATQTFTLTINGPPAFTSSASTTFTLGTAGSFTVTTSGTPSVTSITSANFSGCTGSTLPSGVTFSYTSGTTATIASTTGAPAGTYILCLNAANGFTPNATQSFTLTIANAPSITSANSATFTKGTAGSFTVTTSGSPAVNSITNAAFAGCTPSSLPTGVTFSYTSGTTATIASTTGAAAGVYTLCLNASNGVTPSATQTFTLTINGPPAFTSAASYSVATGTAGSFTVTTSGTPAVTAITDAAFSGCTPSSLPSGVTFSYTSGTTATIASTTGAPVGTYTLCLNALNGFTPNATQAFTYTVGGAPSITSASSSSFTEFTTGSFTFTTSGTPAVTSISDANFSGCTTNLPSGVSFSYTSGTTATISGFTTSTGTYTVCLTASNGISPAATQIFTLHVYPGATSGNGTMTVSPTSVVAGSTGNQLVFTFTAPAAANFSANSYVTLTIPTTPTGWTPITTSNTSFTAGTCVPTAESATGGVLTITLGSGCLAGTSFTVTYGTSNNITAGGVGTGSFTTKTHEGANGNPSSIASQPSVADLQAYTVAYNANTGTGSVPSDPTLYTNGQTVTVLFSPTPTLSGYTFAGWCQTGSSLTTCSGTLYTSTGTSTFNIGATNVTLYAIWTAASTNVITFTGSGVTQGSPGSFSVTTSFPSYGAHASATSGGTPTYSLVSGTCGVNSSTGVVTFVDLSTCVIMASVPASGPYGAATATLSITVNQGLSGTNTSITTPTITFGSEGGASFSGTVTGASGDGYPEGTVSVYYNDATSPVLICSETLGVGTDPSTSYSCSTSSNTQLGGGTYNSVVAIFTPGTPSSSNSNYSYTGSSSSPTSFSVGAGSQSITATPGDTSTPWSNQVTVGATGYSGTGTITLVLDTGANGNTSSGDCSLVGDTLSATGSGTCYVYATIAGDPNYTGATSADETITFTAASQSITATPGDTSTPWSNQVTVGATGYSGTGTITLVLDTGANGNTSSGDCSLVGDTLSATGSGTCYVYATIAGDPNYTGATSADETITFTAASQSITATPGDTSTPWSNQVTVGATGYSGTGTITLVLDTGANGNTSSGDCSLVGDTLSATGSGTCYVYATIAGDPNYTGATSADETITFTAASQSITATPGDTSTPWSNQVTVGATGYSGTGTITLVLDTGANGNTSSGDCSLVGDTLSATGSGTCYVYATIAGDPNYTGATSADETITFTAASQSITATPGDTSTPWSNQVTVGATGYSGTGTITLVLDTGANGNTSSGDCSLVGDTLSATGSGTCYVYATIAGDPNYTGATSADETITFTAASQSITATPGDTSTPWSNQVTVGATGYSGTGTITLVLDTGANGNTSSGDCSLVGDTLSATGSGTCYVYATIAGDPNYTGATSADETITFTAASQSITATPGDTSTPWSNQVTVGATGYSGTGTITLVLDTGANGNTSSGDCSLVGDTLSATGSGTCYVYATIAGDPNYTGATSADETITFTAASQSITATPGDTSTPWSNQVTVGATGYSGTGTITLVLDTGANGNTSSGDCSLVGDTLSATGSGTCYVYATIAGDPNYTGATSADETITFTAASQSITATPGDTSTPWSNQVTVGATGYSGTGTITLVLDTGANGNTSSGDCSLVGDTLSATGSGTCYVYATIAGDPNYTGATSADETITFTAASQSITATPGDTSTPWSNQVTVGATGYSGTGTITLVLDTGANGNTSSGDCSLVGDTLSATGSGTCYVYATIAGDPNYTGATSADETITFTAASQSITATPGDTSTPWSNQVTVGATGYSGTGTITLVLDTGANGNTSSGDCSLVGDTLSATGSGTCYVYATIAGDPNYTGATSADETITFTAASQSITATPGDTSTPWSNQVTVGATGYSGTGTITLVLDTGANGNTSSGDCSLVGDTLSATGSGTCYVYATIAGDPNYTGATSADETITFTAASQSITATPGDTSTPWSNQVTVGATGYSGTGTITLVLDTGANGNTSSGDCSLVGDTLSATGSGTCYVYATIAGDPNYTGATSADETITFTAASQSITATPGDTSTPWSNQVTVGATGYSGTGTITLVLDTGANGNTSSGDCSLVGDTLSATGSGTCYVYATIAGDPNYTGATSADETITFTAASQSITATPGDTSTPWSNQVTVGATGYSGTGTITLVLDTGANGNTSSGDCSLVGDTLSATGSGTCYVYATIAGDPNYTGATSADETITFTAASQSITATPGDTSTPWSNQVTVGATGYSGTGTITLVLDTGANGNTSSGDCSLVGDTLSATGSGTCYVYATIAGDPNYTGATSADETITFTAASQSITATPGDTSTPWSNQVTVGATGYSGTGTITLVLDTGANGNTSSGDCSLVGDTLSATGSGTCYVYATIAGDPNYTGATSADETITFTAASQSITATPGDTSTPWSNQVTVGATGYSGTGTITLVLDTGANGNTSSGDCSLVGDTLSATGSGTCYVYATIAGDPNYTGATSADETITFTAASQSITATPGDTSTPWSNQVTVGATGYSGTGTITLVLDTGANGNTSSGDCSLVGDTLSATGSGTCYVYATIAGDPNYTGATSADETITFTAASQSITATPGDTSTPWSNQVTVGATGYSGTGTITLVLDTGANGNTSSGDCSLVGDTLSATGSGTCYVYATIAGDPNYTGATSADETITFTAASQSITATPGDTSTPWSNQVTVGATGYSGTGTITLVLDTGANGNTSSGDCSLVGDTLSATGSGTCYVYATIAGDPNYTGATSADETITFTAASQSITAPSAPSGPWSGSLSVFTTSSSGLTVTYTVIGGSASGCSVNTSGIVTASGAGTCVIQLSQGGSLNYSAAPPISVTATFTAVSQSITAPSAPSGPWSGSLSVFTTSSSGLTVTYTVIGGSASGCSVNTSGIVTASGAGTCVIQLSQGGSLNYSAAPPISVTATFTAVTYTVVFAPDGGSGTMANETFTAGVSQGITPNGFTLANSTFAGWATSFGGPVVYANYATITVSGNETLYAVWTPITYTVVFAPDGGSGTMANETFTAGVSQGITPNGFTLANSTFAGWATSFGGPVVYANYATITVSGNETLYAVWTPSTVTTVTVSFNAEGGSAVSSLSGPSGTTITLPAAPTYAGHTFNGWFAAASGGTALTSPYTLTTSTTLYAQWTTNATVTVSFNAEGGSAVSSLSGPSGTTITLPAAPTYAGHTFNGWFAAASGGTALTSPYTLTTSTTLYAQWTTNATVTVSFNAEGGSAVSSLSGPSGTTITLPAAPTYAGHTFNGWFAAASGGTALTSPYTLTTSTTLYAQWTTNATVTVSFNAEGGSAVSSLSGPSGTTITLPAAPTYAGHTFNGWFAAASGGTALTSPYTLTTSTTLYAQWTTNATVTVSFNAEGGSAVSSLSGPSGTTITLPAAPTYAGHTFNGWFAAASGGTALTSPYTLTTSTTLYAQWTVVKTLTSTTLSLNASSATYGNEGSVVYTVGVSSSVGTPTGTVSILWGSTTLCVITLSGGAGHCSAGSAALPVGSQLITASYSGDASHNGSTSSSHSLNITKDNSHSTVSESASNAAVGSEGSVLFTATVSSNNGESIPSGESVTIHVGSASCSATTNGSGSASCSIGNSALSGGTYAVSASYAGDSNINGSTSTNSLSFTVGSKPVFTSSSSLSVAVGQYFYFQVSVNGSVTKPYSLSGNLPHGVFFNPYTGVLFGAPYFGTTGTYTFTITATNASGSTSQTFNLKVTAH